jgi:hypothetical protein
MDRTAEGRRWAMAIEGAAFGVWDLDPALDIVHYSPQWKAHLGFPRIHAPDSSVFWRCRVHPDDFDPMLESLRSHLDGFTPAYEMRFRLRSNGSGYRSMLSRGRVVARDDRGNATRMLGTMLDLTGRPSSAGNYGLATERPARADELPRQPFHAVLGGARRLPGRSGTTTETSDCIQASCEQESRRLVERIEDLLEAACREADAALQPSA